MDRGGVVPVEIAYFAITAYLFRVLYFPFTALAVLRSAENYTGPRLWPFLAKAFTVSLWLIFLAQLLVGMGAILTSRLNLAASLW